LFRFRSIYKVVVGDSLDVDCSQSLKSSGIVVRVVKRDDGYYFLATFEVSQVKNRIFLNNDISKLVNIIHE